MTFIESADRVGLISKRSNQAAPAALTKENAMTTATRPNPTPASAATVQPGGLAPFPVD
ncbi:hypothetical protein HS041_27425 [Planomonospora sp. ID67723]|uniref:hypothetical protein n=1 Tax=Planomonospora sp. ID67723 TaxID=2738134 RepID=UPI0018C35BC3|nr:hypothetical protein [Planomonospora sp. ID67723]MBG0831478.1 hypothetical protein [Planomonospora sp. ID67723]